jgi:hypothetical protein
MGGSFVGEKEINNGFVGDVDDDDDNNDDHESVVDNDIIDVGDN